MKGGIDQYGAELPTLGNVERLQEHWRRGICGDDKCRLDNIEYWDFCRLSKWKSLVYVEPKKIIRSSHSERERERAESQEWLIKNQQGSTILETWGDAKIPGEGRARGVNERASVCSGTKVFMYESSALCVAFPPLLIHAWRRNVTLALDFFLLPSSKLVRKAEAERANKST